MAQKTPEYYVNRELSWLSFNHRVLQEAKDPSVPLLERINYLAIYASNLDEFFKVRVATIKRLIHLQKNTKQRLDEEPEALLDQIKEEVVRQRKEFNRIFQDEILRDLEKNYIHFLDEYSVSQDQMDYLENYFIQEIQPRIEPVIIEDDGQPLFLRDDWLYFAILLKPNEKEPHQYGLLKFPESLPRFVTMPEDKGHRYVIYLDDVIRLYIQDLFPGFEAVRAYAIRVLRDAELDIEGDVSESVLKKIKQSLKQRELGEPTRISYDPEIPGSLLHVLSKKINLEPEDPKFARKYHDFTDLFNFPFQDRKDLKYDPMPPLKHHQLQGDNVFKLVKNEDRLIHFPYQNFNPIIDWLKTATEDAQVTHIYITLYRLARESDIVKELIRAARKGKHVTVIIELKARFDEASNIQWFNQLEKAGAEVMYSYEVLKVHCKIMLFSRKDKDRKRHYAYLNTGNFNEDTARLYSDTGFFTCDRRITNEAKKLFEYFTKNSKPPEFKHLWVAPFNIRDRFNAYMDQEIKNAKAGKEAYAIIKVNSLQDPKIIKKLYKAGQEGVKIFMITRSICCAIPGIPEISDNIRAISIVDRFLEHSRMFCFANGGNDALFIGSSDLMKRNLDKRIETLFPIFDEALKKELLYYLKLQLNDNKKARIIDAHQNNEYQKNGQKPVRSQYEFYRYCQSLLKNDGIPAELHFDYYCNHQETSHNSRH